MSDSVTFTEAIIAPFSTIYESCNYYTFPGGWLAIWNLICYLMILFVVLNQFYEGYIIGGIAGGIFGMLFMLIPAYTQAYLIKGCKCAKKK